MANTNLANAKAAKKDEFYTSLRDIEEEMRYYEPHFRGKIVLCNCDDPYESNFFKYFAMNFNYLGLKKLIATCYNGSPVADSELLLFPEEHTTDKKARKIVITEVQDNNGDGAIDLADVEWLIRNEKNVLTELKGNGDFRSDECIELLKEADIVVTNPPFSLFREYLAQLVTYGKQFLNIGNINAVSSKDTFQLIMDNRLWLGASIHSGDREFRVPDDYPLNAAGQRTDERGVKYIRVKGVRWFTNLDYPQRHEDIELYKRYNPEEYPKYDNYDAINVNVTNEIPKDYYEPMGVPITFLDKYNPSQFEILGLTQIGCHDKLPDTRRYNDYKEVLTLGDVETGASGGKTNENAVLIGKGEKKTYYRNSEGRMVHSELLLSDKTQDGIDILIQRTYNQ